MPLKKTWNEKLAATNSKNDLGVSKQTPKGLMYISKPREVVSIIKKVPKGKLITTSQIRKKLTKKHKVDFTCPLTTGIWISLLANASEENLHEKKKVIAPYWIVLKPKGLIYEKYLGQKSLQNKYLKAEGFKITKSSKNLQVKDFEKYLVS